MVLRLLIDNWLLQDIATILKDGLSKGIVGQLLVDYKNDAHGFEDIPFAGIQTEALLSLLTDIVTRDELILDQKYAYVWTKRSSPALAKLEKEEFLKIRQFDTTMPDLEHIRELALQDLCVTQSLRQVRKQNEESWTKEDWTKEPFLSPVIWGTAENLEKPEGQSPTGLPVGE